ncbi:MAG: hypothetical protein KO202_02495 [Methanobacteriaceae archaeon]|jgi:hypothetical protein|nr:hypothetical protein [Methanobacteriaceae archaeon]
MSKKEKNEEDLQDNDFNEKVENITHKIDSYILRYESFLEGKIQELENKNEKFMDMETIEIDSKEELIDEGFEFKENIDFKKRLEHLR